MTPDLGDRVRVLDNAATRSSGHAGMEGLCYGFTTPSITGVEVIGDATGDIAFNVSIEGVDPSENWFGEDCVELVDHSPGLVVGVGDAEFVRTETGDWVRLEPDEGAPPSRWWQRFRRDRRG